MRYVQMLLTFLLDVLFPRSQRIAQCDRMDVGVLAMRTHLHIHHRRIDCYAPLRYASPVVRTCVHAAKYHAHARAASLLGEVLAPYIAEVLAEQTLFGLYERPILVPVPLSKERMRERGYNQAERIARTVAKLVSETPPPIQTDVLVRTRHTSPQTRHGKKERLHNMHDAFSVVLPEVVRGQDIVLIDDVVTTGATLNAARKVLEEAGARTVLCIAVAH